MKVTILEDASPRVFLANQVFLQESDEEILELMKKQYLKNTAFIKKQDAELLCPVSKYEKSEVLDYVDMGRNIKVTVDAAQGNILVLNDYFTDTWEVYIDGKQQQMLKTNYLFRGVVIPSDGIHSVEFVYRNKRLMRCASISLFGFVLLMGVIVRKEKIKVCLEKYINSGGETNETNHTNTML